VKTHLTVWGLLTFAILGLCMSGYLTYLSMMPPPSCPVGEFGAFSCNEVIYSQYARVYGISVALLGLGWFVVALGLIVFAWRDQRLMWAVVAWSMLGAAGIAGFVRRVSQLIHLKASLGTSQVMIFPQALQR